MISLRRSEDRWHIRRGLAHHDLTFGASLAHERYRQRFHALVGLDEDRLPPGAGASRRATRAAEVITYVLEGAVSHHHSPTPLVAGEFQCWHVQRSGHYHGNASRTERAHCFQISLRQKHAMTEPIVQQRRFPAADRRDALRIVASPDGRDGSLQIAADAMIYSAMLPLGQHVAHELSPSRGVWLHIVSGEAQLGTLVLKTGDGAGITSERVVSLTADAPTELLIIDLATRGIHNDPQQRLTARAYRKRSSPKGAGELSDDAASDEFVIVGSQPRPRNGES